LEKYKDYGKMEKEGMTGKIQELEQLVDSREDYILNLEREAVMLRKEIKDAKYNNEKNSYKDFVKNLTVLRPERGRSGPRV
jgi:molecular chaperone GrpE (heat shock protein)